jgi:peptidoglycan-N-acetylglucosamine deacetylase
LLIQIAKLIQVLFPSLIWRQETKNKDIWLTFDDGPTPEVTPWILAALKQEKIKATFFLVGKQIEKYPKLLEDIINDGHIVANHSYSHKNGWFLSKKRYISDIERCQKLIPKNSLFRPPYGKISPAQIFALKKKYKIILWDVLAWDFQQNITPKKVQRNILNNTNAGSIIVLHNNQISFKNLQPILKETIQTLKNRGFSFSITW